MAKLILGAFADRADADKTIKELQAAGVAKDDFSVIGKGEMDVPVETKGEPTRAVDRTTTAEGAAIGGATGGLAGLIAGAIATAGLFVTGPVVALVGLGWVALTTVAGGAIGAAAGGLIGALVSLGIPRASAERHQSIIAAGGILLGVQDKHVKEDEIRKAFESHNAEEIAVVEHGDIPARVVAAVKSK